MIRKSNGCVWLRREYWIHMDREPVRTLSTLDLSGDLYWLIHRLLPRIDAQMHNCRALREPVHSVHPVTGGDPQQLCLYVCLWQVEILCAALVMQECQLSSRSHKDRSHQPSQLFGGKRVMLRVFSAFVFFIWAHVFLFRFSSRFDLHSSNPSGFCATFSARW